MSTPGISSVSDHLQSMTEGMASVMQAAGLVALAIALVVFCVACVQGKPLGPSFKLLFLSFFVASAPMVLSVLGSVETAVPVAHASSVPSSQADAPEELSVQVQQEPWSAPQTWEAGGSID